MILSRSVAISSRLQTVRRCITITYLTRERAATCKRVNSSCAHIVRCSTPSSYDYAPDRFEAKQNLENAEKILRLNCVALMLRFDKYRNRYCNAKLNSMTILVDITRAILLTVQQSFAFCKLAAVGSLFSLQTSIYLAGYVLQCFLSRGRIYYSTTLLYKDVTFRRSRGY